MNDVGQIDESGWFYTYVVKKRVAMGFIIGILLLLLASPTKISLLLGLPFAVLGEVIRTWSSGVISKNHELATEGPYALSRNPLYVGSFTMALGVSIMTGSLLLIVVVPVMFYLVYDALVRTEEKVLMELYPDTFMDYCSKVPRTLSLKNWPVEPTNYDVRRMVMKHKEWQAWLGLYAIIIYLFIIAG